MGRLTRGESGISCMIGVDKPTSLSSHDIVNIARKSYSERRVGHGGTLDVPAHGVLPIMVGPATKLMRFFDICTKKYRGVIKFGYSTDSCDATGNVLDKGQINDYITDKNYCYSILNEFIGKQDQMPPLFSAKKVNGKTSYKEIRKGEKLELKSSQIEIFDFDLVDIFIDKNDNLPCWEIDIEVSGGTYIRSLARDIGNRVSTPSHLHSLTRTQVGGLKLQNCISVEQLKNKSQLISHDPASILPLKLCLVNNEQVEKIRNGQRLFLNNSYSDFGGTILENDNNIRMARNTDYCFVCDQNKIYAIYKKVDEIILKPECVFNIPIERQGNHGTNN